VAREAGVSPSTVRGVRRRVQRGDDPLPVPRRRQHQRHAVEPPAAPSDGPDLAAILHRLQHDPALRVSESGRQLLRWIFARAIRADERLDVIDKVPPHCTYIIADVARSCADACSAAYVMDSTMRTAVVKSLFGDGAAAVAVVAPDAARRRRVPRVLDFASRIITDAIGAMRYDWDEAQHRFSFFLDPDIPYVVGANAGEVVGRLLGRAGLRRNDIRHWLVHSGGKKVIDAVRVNLGLTRHDVRHTTGVLRDYGNLSNGCCCFSDQRLLREAVAEPGDLGVLMTMGPGSTIETALVQW
jgi:hypothetical protein